MSSRDSMRALFTIVVGATLGCSSTSVGAEGLAGTYTLESVDGHSLPDDRLGGAIRGELVLWPDGTARRVVAYATSGIPGPIVVRGGGAYRVREGEIALDLIEEARGPGPSRALRMRGRVAAQRILLRYSGVTESVVEEVYVRVR